MPLKFLAP